MHPCSYCRDISHLTKNGSDEKSVKHQIETDFSLRNNEMSAPNFGQIHYADVEIFF